jgi:hypothetical protein
MGPSRRLFWTNEPVLARFSSRNRCCTTISLANTAEAPKSIRTTHCQAAALARAGQPGVEGEAVVESRSLLVPVRFGPNDYALFPSLQVIVSETVTRTLFLALRLTISGIRVMRLCRNRQKNRELKYNISVNHGINIITWSL